MTHRQSAGLLLYRNYSTNLEVFLVHPGGPFWRNKDDGAWSIPKGEFDDEEPLRAAIREFTEETGITVLGDFIELMPVILKGGKKVFAWALQKDINAAEIKSNHFEIEWPPRSGKLQSFPEVDKGEWFTIEETKKKINIMQVALIEELWEKLNA